MAEELVPNCCEATQNTANVDSMIHVWKRANVIDKQQFLTFLQSQGVVISPTEIRFKGNA